METSVELVWHRLGCKYCCVSPQYSQKEDKYEEEIKILTDKLKEVSSVTPNTCFKRINKNVKKMYWITFETIYLFLSSFEFSQLQVNTQGYIYLLSY